MGPSPVARSAVTVGVVVTGATCTVNVRNGGSPTATAYSPGASNRWSSARVLLCPGSTSTDAEETTVPSTTSSVSYVPAPSPRFVTHTRIRAASSTVTEVVADATVAVKSALP